MDKITYKSIKEFNVEDIKGLYEDAGWTNYINDLPKLMNAIEGSLDVISAWDEDKLVGLIRIIGDGLTIVYIQDILVLKAYKRKGIGTKLFNHVLDKYSHVRQKVLLTDDSEETRGFYEANGFISCDKGKVVAFAKFS